MASEEDEQSPFTRPGFIIAAAMLFLIIVGGVGIAIFGGNKDKTPTATPTPSATLTAEPDPEPTADTAEASVCGLNGEVVEEARLTSAPEAEWDYQDTTAYPTSDEFGPGEVSDEGYRYCFARNPEGALFAAANAVVQATDMDTIGSWLDYFIADGPNREAVLSEGAGGEAGQGSRIEVVGFRLLSYDGYTANVDVAVRGSAGGEVANLSMVYSPGWEAGDWKLDVPNASAPINVANIPDLSGYITWRP